MLLRNACRGCRVLAAVLVAGCAVRPSTETRVARTVSVLNVQMLSTDMFAQKFKVRVLVKNPNDLEIPVSGIEYTIILMGDSFAEGDSSDQFLLPAKGEAEFDMLVTTNFVSSFGRLLSRVGGGKLQDLRLRDRREVSSRRASQDAVQPQGYRRHHQGAPARLASDTSSRLRERSSQARALKAYAPFTSACTAPRRALPCVHPRKSPRACRSAPAGATRSASRTIRARSAAPSARRPAS